MKKKYVAPEMETVKITVQDVILSSILESSIPEVIGGDDGGEGSELDLDL